MKHIIYLHYLEGGRKVIGSSSRTKNCTYRFYGTIILENCTDMQIWIEICNMHWNHNKCYPLVKSSFFTFFTTNLVHISLGAWSTSSWTWVISVLNMYYFHALIDSKSLLLTLVFQISFKTVSSFQFQTAFVLELRRILDNGEYKSWWKTFLYFELNGKRAARKECLARK